jgi:hypothetical protein
VRSAALIAAQPAAALHAIKAAVARSVAAYRSGPGYAVPIVAILGSGIRPQARFDSPGATAWPVNARTMSSRAFGDRR